MANEDFKEIVLVMYLLRFTSLPGTVARVVCAPLSIPCVIHWNISVVKMIYFYMQICSRSLLMVYFINHDLNEKVKIPRKFLSVASFLRRLATRETVQPWLVFFATR